MMWLKLQDKINRRIGDKEYRRWYVNISNDEIERLEWRKGEELKTKINGNRLILEPE